VSARQFSLCNVVLEARLDSTGLDERIAETLVPYRKSGVNVMWKLGPSTRPHDLDARLVAHGFRVRPALHGMALRITGEASVPIAVPGLLVREVTDVGLLDLWRRAVDRGFRWPSYGAQDLADNLGHFFGSSSERPFVAYVGISGGQPVASSLVFFGAGVAGIYHVSTVPEHRRRGVGAAVTGAALRDAHTRGYRVAILHATEMGAPIYRRLGFRDVCIVKMRLYLPGP
jgi:GNAT superfamily N-acetyltransferase